MPFALAFFGTLLLVAGVRNTQDDLFTLLRGDVTGKNNFIYWIIAVMILGGLGYIPKLKPLSNAFLVLIIIVLFLSNGGFFQKFNQQIATTQKPPTTGPTQNAAPSLPSIIQGAKNAPTVFA